MDTLELLLRDEDNYKQGVYWCVRRGTVRSGRLESLLRRDRVYLVEVDGFDEFTADLHKAAGLAFPKPIARPFDMARDRAKLFIQVEDTLKAHPVIGAHIREVLRNISSHSQEPPLPVQAAILSTMGESAKAIPIWKEAHREDPTDIFIAYQYADALADAGENEELAKFVHESPLPVDTKIYFLLRAGHNQEVIDLATETLAGPATVRGNGMDIVRINRAIALKRIGRTNEMAADLDFLEQNGYTANTFVKAGVAALKGAKEEMFDALRDSLYKTISPKQLRVFPVFEDYRADPDFVKFMGSEGNN